MEKAESLQNAMAFHNELISRKGMSVNSPLVRRLQEIIKIAFGKDGQDAIVNARIESQKVPGSNINALIRRTAKTPGEARPLRKAQTGLGAITERALTKREERNLYRGVYKEVPTQSPELEGKVKAVAEDNTARVLNANEVSGIAEMSPKEIVEKFGIASIDLTLEKIGVSATGSERQRAAKLKKGLTA